MHSEQQLNAVRDQPKQNQYLYIVPMRKKKKTRFTTLNLHYNIIISTYMPSELDALLAAYHKSIVVS